MFPRETAANDPSMPVESSSGQLGALRELHLGHMWVGPEGAADSEGECQDNPNAKSNMMLPNDKDSTKARPVPPLTCKPP